MHVTSIGCDQLVIEDQSKWMNGIKPEYFTIELTVPTMGVTVNLSISTDGRNIFTVQQLFGKGDGFCLPDDIYCFVCGCCGMKYTINRAVTCNTDCRIEEMLAKAETPEDLEEYDKFRNMALALKAAGRLGKKTAARNMLKAINKEFKNRNCEDC